MGANTTKDLILKAAVELMALKGENASIAEIASAAGVTVSHIYHYFKNKEDLLFHTIGAYLEPRLPVFEMKLQGIREPLSLLTKLIWEQQHYHLKNPNYAKFSLFECRSRKNFFHHPAFAPFSYWARVTKKILKTGQEEGVFHAGVSATVARDMIQGLLDIEDIFYFSGIHPDPPIQDFDGILDLLLPMLLKDGPVTPDSRPRPQIIMEAAEKLFAEKGYQGSTTLEIAKMSGMAERTLYEYFKNKEDILFSTLQNRFRGHIQAAGGIHDINKPVGKLRRFTYYCFTILLRQPDFAKMVILEGIFNPRFYHSKAFDAFTDFLQGLDRIIDEGKADGSIDVRLDNRIFKNMFVGIFSYTLLRYHFSGEKSFRLNMGAWIEEVIQLLIRAVQKAGQASGKRT